MSQKIECPNHQQLLLHQPNSKEGLVYPFCSKCLADFEKQQYTEELNPIIKELVSEIKELHKQIKILEQDKDDFYIELSDCVLLVGPIKNGRKEGEFYYKFDDGTKQYVSFKSNQAGQYINNQKEGIWNDFVSYKCLMDQLYLQQGIFIQEKKKIMKICSFVKGVKQPKCILEEYTNDGYGDKIEKYGLYDQLTQVGLYNDLGKISYWRTLYGILLFQTSGGGFYSQTKKNGDWIEPSLKYNQYHQITFLGNIFMEYVAALGQFNTMDHICGFYDKNGKKTGHWTDISEDLGNCFTLTQQGNYEQGYRKGEWKTYYNNQEIGGGSYDDKGKKQGFWIDFNDNYWEGQKVTEYGNYKNGLRTGFWKVQIDDEIINSGCYDEHGVKQGDWIEVNNNIMTQIVITQGKYKNGLRIGKWAMIYQGKEIGYGNYDDNGVKQSLWIELYQNFWELKRNNQIRQNQIVQAGYYVNGLRYGQWSLYIGSEVIGGGLYDDQGNKTGQWIDLHDNYFKDNKVTEEGVYNQGLRIGQWDICYNQRVIGGGNYNERGQKEGSWIDVQIIILAHTFYFGEYKNGQRIGQWKQKASGIDSFYAYYQLNPKTQLYEIE